MFLNISIVFLYIGKLCYLFFLALSNHASTSNSSPSSVLWRRSTSTSSIVNKQQQPKQFSSVIGTTNNS